MIGKKGLLLTITGAALVGGVIVAYYIFWPRGVQFQDLKLLDKRSLIKVLTEIRAKFSEQFLPVLKINRTKRRACPRGGRDYVYLTRDLKNHASNVLQRAIDSVLSQYKLNEEILTKSIEEYERDPDVKAAMVKMCGTIEPSPSPLLTKDKLEAILKFYIRKVEAIDEDDPESLNIKMKMLEDEMVEEFGFEPEDIDAGITKYSHELRGLVHSAKQLHDHLRENNNLF